METEPREPKAPVDRAVAALVNEYFDRRQAGEALDPAAFAAEHPDLADDLQPYLEGLALIDQARAASGSLPAPAAKLPPTPLPDIAGYEVLAEIGRGGMGVVYRALQTATKRIVAIKVMLGGPFASAEGRYRFAREVELAARLDHAGVVRVLESGTVNEQPYYAMDFIDGLRLDRYLIQHEPDARATIALFRALCETIHAAHDRGVVHRDLKPGNVLIDDEGRPHVLDFGLAKAVRGADGEDTTQPTLSLPGQIMGTLSYLSPEQAAGDSAAVDARTDVYALGVMLYEALTGSLPYNVKGQPSTILTRILELPPEPPTRLSPNVDAELETILLKTLTKERERRYPSAAELGADLDRYLHGEPILARRPSSLYILRKRLLKYRVQVAVAAVAALLLAVGLFSVQSWQRWHATQQAARAFDDARRTALRARQLLDIGDIVNGRATADAVFARHPALPEAPLVAALARYRGRMAEEAITTLERAQRDGAHGWAATLMLSEIHRNAGNLPVAEQLAADARRRMPDTGPAHYLASLAMIDPDDALFHARRCTECAPDFVEGWSRLAHLYLVAGDWPHALEGATELARLEPANPSWRILQGRILLRQRDFAAALEVFDAAAAQMADTNAVRMYRAIAYRGLRRYAEAVSEYDAIIDDTDTTPATTVWHRFQRATPLWMAGRPADAIADYVLVRTMHGRPHYADARRAIILRELGRTDAARAALGEALASTDEPWLARIFGCLLGEVSPGDLVASADTTRPAQVCEACYYAGEACLGAGDVAQARAFFRRAVATGIDWDPNKLFPAPMNEYELAAWRLRTTVAG
jgi:tetratricopeptide (TPR) repeat protein